LDVHIDCSQQDRRKVGNAGSNELFNYFARPSCNAKTDAMM